MKTALSLNDSVWLDLVRYGLVEMLGEEWVTNHPVENLSEITENHLAAEGVPAAAAHGIALRVGASVFAIFCSQFAPAMGFLESSFQLQPVQTRLAAGLEKVLAQITTLGGPEITLVESETAFSFPLPVSGTTLPYLYSGFFEAYFEWASNGKTFLYQHSTNVDEQVVVSFNKQPLNV